MDTLSIVLISVFSTFIVVLIAVVLYLVLYRKVTIVSMTGWDPYTIRERRPVRDIFRRKGKAPIPRRGSDIWDPNISEEELGILRPTHSSHSRNTSEHFSEPYSPYSPEYTHNRSASYNSNQSSRDYEARRVNPQDFSDDDDDNNSSLPYYSAPPPTHAYPPGVATPSTSAANTSQPRFTPTSSPPRHSPPPSIIHHIDSFRLETLETTIADIRMTLDSANTILQQVSDLSNLPETTPSLLTPADLAKINDLSSLAAYHEELLTPPLSQPLDVYTTRLPKFKQLVSQGMTIIMTAESRRTRAISVSSTAAANTPSSGTGTTKPQEVKRTQLLSRYSDLKKTEDFARRSLNQILERREARRGSPGSVNRDMELEVRMLGLRAMRERVALGRKLGIEDDDEDFEGEEVWGLDGVDEDVGGERVVSPPRSRGVSPGFGDDGASGRRRGGRRFEGDEESLRAPPPAYDDPTLSGKEAQRLLLESKELD
ncbi:hypothetical protein ABW19_dt0207939 [Dactylella cylindrospora]|nr:hypothetical protein ABW19_dt0207939 [Dactylella cylindrospora]